ncbi:MAG: diguanylate cyclase [Chromatiales bacterium]|jgi:diguanylate cyclase
MAKTETDWKEKYRSLSIKYESEERINADTQKVFCRTLIRLSMAAKGLSNSLDPYLANIQETVRKDCGPGIRKKLDDLSDAMVRSADAQKPADPFERILTRVSVSDSNIKKARRIWQELSSKPAQVSDAQIDALIELLGGDVVPQAASEDKKPGLLGRLFGGDDKAGRDVMPNTILRSVLGQLRWPGLIADQINALAEQLGEQASDDMWVTVITRVNEIVVTALHEFQNEVQSAEDFLSQLSSRLQELDSFVRGAHELREASLQSGRELGRAMDEQVDSLSSSMQAEMDMARLKQTVAEKLDIIHSHVSKHLQADEQRHSQAFERETELRKRLEELEQEAQGLRQQMADAYTRALRDAVTGLPNRMAYDERMEQEYTRWKRFGEPLTLMVWDVDNFKNINDQYGHRSGDKALEAIGARLKQNLRETDFIGRYGGEEFVVLLVGTALDAAVAVADKMREAVAQTSLKAKDTTIHLTISCGLTEFREGDEPAGVFERADAALYRAKREGKNRCITA